MSVKNEKELAQAIKNGDDYIEVEGDLAKKTLKIKATGKVAWAIAIGGIGVATVAILTLPATTVATGGVGVLAKGFVTTGAGATAAGVLGRPGISIIPPQTATMNFAPRLISISST